MGECMDRLGFGSCPEELGNLGQAVLLCLLSEGEVHAIRLTLAREGGAEVVFRGGDGARVCHGQWRSPVSEVRWPTSALAGLSQCAAAPKSRLRKKWLSSEV